MLEVKYIIETGVINAWAASPEHTGGHYEPEAGEAVAVLDIPTPEKPLAAYLYDEATESLIPNPDYVEPEPSDLQAQIDEMKGKMIVSEPTGDEVKITNLVYNPVTKEVKHKEAP